MQTCFNRASMGAARCCIVIIIIVIFVVVADVIVVIVDGITGFVGAKCASCTGKAGVQAKVIHALCATGASPAVNSKADRASS